MFFSSFLSWIVLGRFFFEYHQIYDPQNSLVQKTRRSSPWATEQLRINNFAMVKSEYCGGFSGIQIYTIYGRIIIILNINTRFTMVESEKSPLTNKSNHRWVCVATGSNMPRIDGRHSAVSLLCEELAFRVRWVGIPGKDAFGNITSMMAYMS